VIEPDASNRHDYADGPTPRRSSHERLLELAGCMVILILVAAFVAIRVAFGRP
jgi:hypothetical protein